MFAGNPTEDGATLLEDHTFNITYRTPETAESHSQPLLSCCVLACCSANPNDPNQRKFDLTSKQYTQQGALRTVDSKEVKGSSNRKVTRDQVPTPRTTWPCPPRGHTPSPPPCINRTRGCIRGGPQLGEVRIHRLNRFRRSRKRPPYSSEPSSPCCKRWTRCPTSDT